MIKINLLAEGKRPVVARKQKAPRLMVGVADLGQWLLVAGVLIGFLVAGGWWLYLERVIERKNQEIAINQAEVEKLALVIKEVDEYKAKKTELERKISVINRLKSNQRGPVQIMDHVSRALPELLWLDLMEVNASTIILRGQTFNTTAVANFMDNLDKVPEFQEPILQDTTQQQQTYNFAISLGYSFAPPEEGAGAPSQQQPAGG